MGGYDAYDDMETQVVSPPIADADDHLSEIASAIPPAEPGVLTLKHDAFLAQLLLEEVETESTESMSEFCNPTVLTMTPSQEERGPLSGKGTAKPSPNNMPMFDCYIHSLRSMLWARAEGIERATRLEHLKNTWKSSIWTEEDDAEYTLPDPAVPLVYSLNYTQQCHQQWDDTELPSETIRRHSVPSAAQPTPNCTTCERSWA